jgi:hypothetical protein
MRGPSPLLGYNTNVRHKSKLYHIQTEDSGVNHPHIITHLFADGGRIIASKKTTYEQYLGSANQQEIVKKLMQEQHKAMFIALRDCVYDEDEEITATPTASAVAAAAGASDKKPEPEPQVEIKPPPELDLDALERAAEAKLSKSAASTVRADARKRGVGRYQQTVPTEQKPARASKMPAPNTSIFNGQVLRNKSLDDVILSYLADDTSEEK